MFSNFFQKPVTYVLPESKRCLTVIKPDWKVIFYVPHISEKKSFALKTGNVGAQIYKCVRIFT
jgi:hypothetical protein